MPSLLSRSCANTFEAFKVLRDFVAKRGEFASSGIGWTLWDAAYAVDESTISANDYFVLKSDGILEYITQYVLVRVDATSRLRLEPYLYWDQVKHTGVYRPSSSPYRDIKTNPVVWIFGDLDCVYFAVTHGGSSVDVLGFGVSPYGDGSISPITAPDVSAGSNVTLAIPSPPVWMSPERTVFIHDNSNYNFPVVKDVNGDQVTFYSFTKAFTAGAKIRRGLPVYAFTDTSNPSIATDLNTIWPATGQGVTGPLGTTTPKNEAPFCDVYFWTDNNFYGPFKNMKRAPKMSSVLPGTPFNLPDGQYFYFATSSSGAGLYKQV